MIINFESDFGGEKSIHMCACTVNVSTFFCLVSVMMKLRYMYMYICPEQSPLSVTL